MRRPTRRRERDAPQLCQARRSSRTHFDRSASELLSHEHTTHTYTRLTHLHTPTPTHFLPLFLPFFSSSSTSATSVSFHATLSQYTDTHPPRDARTHKREGRGISARTTNAHTDRQTHTRYIHPFSQPTSQLTNQPASQPLPAVSFVFSRPELDFPSLPFLPFLRLDRRGTRAYEPPYEQAQHSSRPRRRSPSLPRATARIKR